MNNTNDFKKKADEVMSDIYMTEEMKERVIERGRRKKRVLIGRIAALAACAVLILGALILTGILKLQSGQEGQPDRQMNIFSATNTANPGIESLPGQSVNSTAEQSGTGTAKNTDIASKWNPSSLEEAGADFGPGFLAPLYTPEGFKLEQITASGTDTRDADNIILTYSSGKRSFSITEQKKSGSFDPDVFKGYSKVKISGSDGYIKTGGVDEKSSTGKDFTEIYWFNKNIGYSVTGDLTQEDALVTAEMMLPLSKQ